MDEFLTIKETAKIWGVTARRIQYLCREGRIPGAKKIGDIWCIPENTIKPRDRRKNQKPVLHSDELDMNSLYGPKTRKIRQSEIFKTYHTSHANGTGIVQKYDIFPGVQLLNQEFSLENLDYHRTAQVFSNDTFSINHCRQGRFEAEFSDGEFIYLGEGDLAINLPEKAPIQHSFPLHFFQGITIIISVDEAQRGLKELNDTFGPVSIDYRKLRDRLLSGNEFVIIRTNPDLDHIIGKMYDENDKDDLFYLKLKFLELMIYLLSSGMEATDSKPYFHRKQVVAVKAMTKYMTENLDRHFTLEELSEKFGIPLTSMKKCFRGVYGVPVKTYLRNYRIQIAADLLRKTDKPISEIAHSIGYANQSKFTDSFKLIMHISPSEYRKIQCSAG